MEINGPSAPLRLTTVRDEATAGGVNGLVLEIMFLGHGLVLTDLLGSQAIFVWFWEVSILIIGEEGNI